MSDYNVTVHPTVIGPDDRVLLIVGGYPDLPQLEAINKVLTDTFGEGRALVIHGDAVTAAVLRGDGTIQTFDGATVSTTSAEPPPAPLKEAPPDVR